VLAGSSAVQHAYTQALHGCQNTVRRLASLAVRAEG
jgi:hypothetical protein